MLPGEFLALFDRQELERVLDWQDCERGREQHHDEGAHLTKFDHVLVVGVGRLQDVLVVHYRAQLVRGEHCEGYVAKHALHDVEHRCKASAQSEHLLDIEEGLPVQLLVEGRDVGLVHIAENYQGQRVEHALERNVSVLLCKQKSLLN